MAEILVNPQAAPLDTRLDIVIVGLRPDQQVTVRAGTGDRAAEAVFIADERGVVDLTRHAPVGGSYDRVDPMGLFWSMEPTGEKAGPTILEVEGVGKVELDRQRVPDSVRRTEVRERGLVGVLFQPDDDEDTYPGVLLLGGSEGGLHELDAALLAGHGFTVLALAYFGTPGLPEHLLEIPLEYFGTAIDYLRERAGEIGVIGGSRGGEAALLIGATFPEVRAVVSVVGSGVVTQCIGPGNLLQKMEYEGASWTHQDHPIAYLPYTVSEELRRRVVDGQPVPLRIAFDLSDGIPEDAVIPVERIVGGVLLISSGRDGGWPSYELSEVARRRLEEHDHPFPYRHVSYPEAGHLIAGPPYRPTTDLVLPGPGVRFFMDGTPQATAAAQADAWKQTVEFFSEQLGT